MFPACRSNTQQENAATCSYNRLVDTDSYYTAGITTLASL